MSRYVFIFCNPTFVLYCKFMFYVYFGAFYTVILHSHFLVEVRAADFTGAAPFCTFVHLIFFSFNSVIVFFVIL